jgi:hypothetical protein
MHLTLSLCPVRRARASAAPATWRPRDASVYGRPRPLRGGPQTAVGPPPRSFARTPRPGMHHAGFRNTRPRTWTPRGLRACARLAGSCPGVVQVVLMLVEKSSSFYVKPNHHCFLLFPPPLRPWRAPVAIAAPQPSSLSRPLPPVPEPSSTTTSTHRSSPGHQTTPTVSIHVGAVPFTAGDPQLRRSPSPAPVILSQESVHTTLSITHHTRK